MKINLQTHKQMLYPATLGLAGALAVLFVGGWTWVGMALSFCLFGAGLALGKIDLRLQQNESQKNLDEFLVAQQDFGAQIAPVWAGHIGNSCEQMESAVSALAGQFAGIVTNLNNAVSAAGTATQSIENQGSETSLVAVFAHSEQKLSDVVSSQKKAMQGMATMLTKIQGLNQFIAELQEMVTEVGRIAAQANLLSLNAAIEATHAGKNGSGFTVVAHEFRMLSNQSAETGRNISKKVGLISDAIKATCQAAEASVKQEQGSGMESERLIESVLGDFRHVTGALLGSSSMLREESVRIQAEISNALVQLQFQDRVSQILTNVKGNIEHLPAFFEQHRQQCIDYQQLLPLDPVALLTELKASYAMIEQFHVHDGENAAPSSQTEITFF